MSGGCDGGLFVPGYCSATSGEVRLTIPEMGLTCRGESAWSVNIRYFICGVMGKSFLVAEVAEEGLGLP